MLARAAPLSPGAADVMQIWMSLGRVDPDAV